MAQNAPQTAPRLIDGPAAFAVVAGSMLGIGIFLAPSMMARAITDPTVFLATWIVAGVVVLGGVVAYAELGTRMPHAGGDYVFQRAALGPSVAFATGWALFAGIFSGSIATVALALCWWQVPTITGWAMREAAFTLPLVGDVTWAQLLAAGLVMGLTGLNAAGVRMSTRTQQVLTLVPLAVLALLAVYAIGAAGFGGLPESVQPVAAEPVALTAGGLATAWLATNFAFSGWNQVIYVAGEVAEPERTIPRSLLGGTLAVTALYLLLCGAFIAVLGMGGLADAGEAGSAIARALGGEPLFIAMNVLIAMCLIATTNASILGGARVGYAMGRDGAFLRRAGTLNRNGTPGVALWLQGVWSAALILTNTVDALLQAVSVTMLVTGMLSVAAYFVLRARAPDAPGWRAWGHPWLPGLYLAVSGWVLYQEVAKAVRDEAGAPLIGVAVVVGAWLAHRLVWRRR